MPHLNPAKTKTPEQLKQRYWKTCSVAFSSAEMATLKGLCAKDFKRWQKSQIQYSISPKAWDKIRRLFLEKHPRQLGVSEPTPERYGAFWRLLKQCDGSNFWEKIDQRGNSMYQPPQQPPPDPLHQPFQMPPNHERPAAHSGDQHNLQQHQHAAPLHQTSRAGSSSHPHQAGSPQYHEYGSPSSSSFSNILSPISHPQPGALPRIGELDSPSPQTPQPQYNPNSYSQYGSPNYQQTPR